MERQVMTRRFFDKLEFKTLLGIDIDQELLEVKMEKNNVEVVTGRWG